nr:hypothetical protein [Brevibacillus sp. HB2.2]
MFRMSVGGIDNGLRSRTIISADFPTWIDPVTLSKYIDRAPLIVNSSAELHRMTVTSLLS